MNATKTDIESRIAEIGGYEVSYSGHLVAGLLEELVAGLLEEAEAFNPQINAAEVAARLDRDDELTIDDAISLVAGQRWIEEFHRATGAEAITLHPRFA